MSFASPVFLFLFLPTILFGYWASSRQLRIYLLLVTSLFFYAWGEGRYVVVLLLAIAVNHILTIVMDRCQQTSRRRAVLLSTIGLNLIFLFAFKYPAVTQWLTSHAGDSLAAQQPMHLPLGISFFTFQAIAYVVDVYHQKHTPVLNPLKFSVFMSLFPKISAGPIIRYDEVDKALAGPAVDIDTCAYGAKRFIIGLGKKLLIADTLAKTADQIFAIPSTDLTAPVAWLGIVCYTLQIYFDFSGYTDMAIGLGRMLGLTFRENFDYPYIAKSVTEFWRRWHISLSTWLRDYLYTPLLYSLMTKKVRQKIACGQYRTNYRSFFSIIVVFVLCGWWHGSTWNFIIWGLLHGLLLATESWKLGKILKKAPKGVAHCYTLLFIMMAWIFFRIPTVGGALDYIAAMLGFGSGDGITYSVPLYMTKELLLILFVAVLASMPTVRYLCDNITCKITSPRLMRCWPIIESGALASIFLVSLMSAASTTYQPFIYFRF